MRRSCVRLFAASRGGRGPPLRVLHLHHRALSSTSHLFIFRAGPMHQVRHFAGSYKARFESLQQQKEEGESRSERREGGGKTPAPIWVPVAMALIGAATGMFIYDYVASYLFPKEERFPSWDFDWDLDWHPAPHPVPPTDIRPMDPSKPKPRRAIREIILIRHGQYDNVEVEDDEKHGLTDIGKEQAELTGQRLKELLKGKIVMSICHSNMKRARESAAIIAKYFPKVEVIEDPDLAEGVPAIPDPPSRNWSPSPEDEAKDPPRIERAFQKYFWRPLLNPPPPGPNLGKEKKDQIQYEIFVIHGNVIRYFFARALQFNPNGWLRLACFNCGITRLSLDNNGYVSAREFGNVGHLPPDKITYH